MKILMTLMGMDIGGAETHVVELARELCRQGHTIIVASNGGVYESTLTESGIRHVQIPMHTRSAGNMLTSLRLLRKLIREEKPDLVHAHARIPAFLCGILHEQMGFPFITSAHWVFEVTPLLRLMSNWGQRSVAVSEDIKTYLIENYQIPADRISVTINGIDTNQFAPGPRDDELAREFGIGTGPVIGTVSRLDESRELAAKELIGLMPELIQKIPNLQLLVVGGGNQEDVLRRQAEHINRDAGRNAIVMTGARTDIARLVSLCDIFVGVSRAALEAMSAEKPTILAGNEGYIGIFRPEVLALAQESNFCCRGCDPIEKDVLFADLLTLLQSSDDEIHSFGTFGRQVILDYYSVARMTRDYLAAYDALLNPPAKIRAAISGYYGYGNLGDDAILLAISQQLSQKELPVELTVLSRRPKETAREYGLSSVPRFSPMGVWKALKNSDVLISGGGSLLQDVTSTRSLLYYLTVIRMAKAMGKPVFLYANGIGPLNKESNRRKVKQCLELCDAITLRDRESLTQLRKLGVQRDDIIITGDPVFALKADGPTRQDLASIGVPQGRGTIGISVRNLPSLGNFPREAARLCDRIAKEMDKTPVFLVMQESEDAALCQQIQSMMTEPSCIARTPGDPASMLAMIGQMDAVISMRLHTIIFAANKAVPVVGCVYDPKVESFLNILGMPSCGTPLTMNADDTFRILQQLLQNREIHRASLAESTRQLAPMACSTRELFLKMLKSQGLI